jgi:hypothetical protein
MIYYRNILTRELQIIKIGTRDLQNTKFYAILLALVMLAGIFSLSSGISSLMNSVIIQSTGQISLQNITAKSGYWRDIQAAIDWVVAHGGIGNVYIPEGTWNFVNPGESWTGARVVIPAGVNVFGAPTERDANGQVVEWKTVLVMPWDVPGSIETEPPKWFRIEGNGDPNKPSRFSEIKLVGYRFYNSSSKTVHDAINVWEVVNFRIDHCYFRDTTGGIQVIGSANSRCSGVIDHCKLINTRAYVEPSILNCDVGYGVGIGAPGTTFWEDDANKVLGKYLNYSVYIEDCYFSKWRHCVSSNDGAHYVFRHNTVEYDVGYGSVDAHGTYTYVGTRAIEVYENIFKDARGIEEGLDVTEDVIFLRGGAAVIFNNHVENYQHRFIYAIREGNVEKCWPHDVWIWNNTLPSEMPVIYVYEDPDKGAPVEGVDYFLYTKADYTPYPYPHPLTVETTP